MRVTTAAVLATARHAVVLSLLLCGSAWASDPAEKPAAAPSIRVGIVAFQTFGPGALEAEHGFARLDAEAGPETTISVAVGSYDEVLHWFRKGWIDAALVTPGVYASILQRAEHGEDIPPFRYLGTRGKPGLTLSEDWVHPSRTSLGPHYGYRFVAVVHRDSKIQDIENIGGSELLFVHPLSAAGWLLPSMGLREHGFGDLLAGSSFTYSHSASLARLVSPGSRDRVAFVWDGALEHSTFRDELRRLEVPRTWRQESPEDALLIRTGGRHDVAGATLARLIASSRSRRDTLAFEALEDHAELYRSLVAPNDPKSIAPAAVSLDEIGAALRSYAASHAQHQPRVALVLSGGGAKCAYQVGVLRALEDARANWNVALAQDAARDGRSAVPLDFDLVVGTSGGAINAVPVAMGLSASEAGRAKIEGIWRSLDQRDVARLPLPARLIQGAWWTLIAWSLASFVAGQRRRRRFGLVLLGLGAVGLLVAHGSPNPWRWLGDHHGAHHVFYLASIGAHFCGLALCLLGFATLLRGESGLTLRSVPDARIRARRTALLVGLLGLPLLQGVNLVLVQESLFTGDAMARLLANAYGDLTGSPAPASESTDEQLRTLSRRVMGEGHLSRDLVITASGLGPAPEGHAPDLYFYAAAKSGEAPPFGRRQGVDLQAKAHREQLLDVVIGSASIFPLFPARDVANLPEPDVTTRLVDGGFAHNSPIEAAVAWGATHVIVVEATPRAQRGEARSLLRNAIAAVDHLHRQAQLIDARSKENVVVFSIAPSEPHIDVLDFAENLVAVSIERGEQEARAGSAGVPGLGRFRRELGRPSLFRPSLRSVGASPRAGSGS
jgi:predicted acylesterase/phospholipase RssA/ABC-type phosphate/phosphonate transport system substrate-binding protein